MSIIFPQPTSEAAYFLESDDDEPTGGRQTVNVEMPLAIANIPRKNKQQTPQDAIDEFWNKFTTKAPGKATTIIPHNAYVERAAKRSNGKAHVTSTQASYEEAAGLCKAKVEKIVKECKRVNQKYRDAHFDLESDLKWGKRDTLESLCNVKEPPESSHKPKSVKRVADIFDNPKFYIDGPTANDVRQGRDGDCWLMAALCTLSNKPSLIERCCVARNEQVGVYGFVFHRDGEWISEIIDDKLFLTKPDFDESFLERILWEDRERVNSEEQYRKAYQSGSGALYFSQCEHTDETWLPLLEKAYAKAHGDYAAIEGGFTGEGIEDLTGGVTSELYSADILDKEHFWKEELLKVNDQFLFGCSTGMWGVGWGERKGIVERHAYSVMRAVEIDGHRLVLLKNPWGKGEWKGPWSDGSKEWTAEWLTKLEHRFGDDGNFWISYEDLLRKYQAFDRTRLFGPEWKVASLWTTLSVPWTLDYHDTQLAFSIFQTGPVVLVLSQLDDRYYRGLEGQYQFELNFRLHKSGREDYVVRTISPYGQTRSVNVELELEAGDYTVLLKINAMRDMDVLPIEEVIRNHARERRDKLVAVGMSYDLAHSKGRVFESKEEKKARKEHEKNKKEKDIRELKKKLMDDRKKRYYLDVKDQKKGREKKAKAKAKAQLKKAEKAQRSKARKAAKQEAKAKDAKEVKITGLSTEGSAEPATDKHVQIQTPDTQDMKELVSKDSDSSAESSQVKTPSESDKTSTGATALKESKLHPSPEAEPQAESKTDSIPRSISIEELETHPSSQTESPDEERAVRLSTVSTALKDAPGDRNSLPKALPGKAPAQQPADEGYKKDKVETESKSEPSTDGEPSDDDSESTISSVSDLSDYEVEIELERQAAAPTIPQQMQMSVAAPEEEDEFEKNPWNAVATVGIRVYYKVTEEVLDKEIVKLRVVRPNPYSLKKEDDSAEVDSGNEQKQDEDQQDNKSDNSEAQKESEEEKPKEGDIEKGLDVDDSSKDATLVGDEARRRKSIAPINDAVGL